MTGLVPEPFHAAVSTYAAAAGESGPDWLTRLPKLVAELGERWELTIDGPSRYGRCALVVPVLRAGDPAVLKVTWPHPEARHEHLALRAWDGGGAVRLLAAEPSSWAMLLERLDARHDLTSEPVETACAVIGELLRRLGSPALPQLPRLSDHAGRQVGHAAGGAHGIPRRLLEQAGSLARDLVADPEVDARLVHTDLHYENVLAADREPWLAIDPKPLAAEPAYAVAPVLWNRWEEAVAGSDVRSALRRRLSVVCEHGGIDEDRARAWTIVREVQNALWAAAGPQAAARVTVAVTILKAMND
jgi:streptomycin 6-kinase